MSRVNHLKAITDALRQSGFIVADLTSKGRSKYMGVCVHPAVKIGRRLDIRFVAYDSYFPSLLYFTGSKRLNVLMREIALEKGYTLNEYGLYRFKNGIKGEKLKAGSEKAIFALLGIRYLSPIDRDL